jgi:CPA1 family monovalent cation:H+ antiporter
MRQIVNIFRVGPTAGSSEQHPGSLNRNMLVPTVERYLLPPETPGHSVMGFDIFAIVITLAALFAYLNFLYFRMPATIGVMMIALIFSLAMLLVGKIGAPAIEGEALQILKGIDFNGLLLHGMLSFLLFAGALHIDFSDLWQELISIALLATVGVILSTLVVGVAIWSISAPLGLGVTLIQALLFGALISPTDPVAVLGIMKSAGASKSLEIQIAGESLFNDGVGVAVFLTLIGASVTGELSFKEMARVFFTQAVGGIGLGAATGWLTYEFLKRIDNYQVEVLITLALAAGGYSLADYLNLSAPIGTVVAGLFIGNRGRAFAMSEETRTRVDDFWEILDEMFNAILFVLVGLELLLIALHWAYLAAALLAIPITLLARFFSVAGVVEFQRLWRKPKRHIIALLTWSGLRGGISVALALSLPPGNHRDLAVAMTYAVVVFSVLVQGMTIAPLARRITREDRTSESMV